MARAAGLERAEMRKPVGDGTGVKCLNALSYEKYDYTRCCVVFGGIPGKIVSEVVMVLYCYGCLWANVSVFASTLASLVIEFVPSEDHCDIYKDPSAACQGTYYGSAMFYGVVVVLLSCLDVTDQVKLQMGLTVYRFAGFAVMLATVIIGLAMSGPMPAVDTSYTPSDAWGFHPSGFAVLVTSAAYAYTVHYNMPGA